MRSADAPDVDFRSIRAYGSPASRSDAFEELTSLLIKDGLVEWPDGTQFDRFGNPDGGREGRGVLPNGDVWAWQAKYLFSFGADEIGQVHDSVVRALGREPHLKRYFITLPYDLPAGDTDGPRRPRKSAHTKWLEKKSEWEALAAAQGMSVSFEYLGAHSLVSALTEPRHAGRLRYWFNASVLSPEDLRQRLSDVVAKAGRRYSPRVHVEVDAVQALEALGRSDVFAQRVQMALAGLRGARNEGWYPPSGDEKAFRAPLKKARKSLVDAEIALEGYLASLRSMADLPDVTAHLRRVEKKVGVVHGLLRERHLQDGRNYYGDAASLYGRVQKASEAVWAASGLIGSVEANAARRGQLLMTGRAGVGKTHLFCDAATRRIAAGMPTLIALGQDFDTRTLLPQLGERLGLDGTLEEILDVLDASGEAAGHHAMLMIDAINEAAGPERWSDDLQVLATAVERHPHVVLAISCRTEFLRPVVGEAPTFARIAHRGFDEATSVAVDRYTTEYNLERLTFPVLNPEFSNPLFLKLACEALMTLGATEFKLGVAGLATVCDAFLQAVNIRLSAPSRCDYDEASNLVQQVVRTLAESGPGPYERDELRRITEALLPNRPWSKSLLQGLQREGVLMDTYDGQIAFSYQRLGDVARAALIAAEPRKDVRAWYKSLGRGEWAERGTLAALAVIAPETKGVEVIDLFKRKSDGSVKRSIIDAFVESLTLRAPQHTTDRTAKIVEQLIAFDEWTETLWDQLVRVACVPGHRLNAEWTHEYLLSQALPERDATWSEWLVGATEYGEENAVTILLNWAWPPRDLVNNTSSLPDEVSHLASLVLGWLLTTPDRRVRDRATKALVSIGERGPAGFAAAVGRFRTCDDPYVTERLAAAICAVTMRSHDPQVITAVADAASELVIDAWPEHLLTRDYLRRTAQAAGEHGWTGPSWTPPYGAKWPIRAKSAKAIETLVDDPEHRYSSIWHSLNRTFGDFGNYVTRPALEHFDHPDHKKLRAQVERVIFSRVLQLGWTPERFGHLDRGRRGGHDSPVERYGKKYQWIGLYECLGRLADNHMLREGWSRSVEPFPYTHPEQVVYRDIDPTVLVTGGVDDPADETRPWFAPTHAAFPSEVSKRYPRDLDGVPDPLDLISLTASDGTQWLSLIRHANWTQVHPPEIEALKAPSLNIWMQIRGYLVPNGQVQAVREWATGQDWDGRWMSENAELHSCLLAAHPNAPEWDWADGNAEPRSLGDRDIPAEILQPIAWYGGTGTSRESAGTNEPTGYVPSRVLFKTLQLVQSTDFRWRDHRGSAVTDPTAGMDETSTLVMRRDLASSLADAGYGLFWTVLANKLRHDHTYGRPGKKYRWLSASASYLSIGESVTLVSSDAWLCRPVPGGDPKPVPWALRTTG